MLPGFESHSGRKYFTMQSTASKPFGSPAFSASGPHSCQQFPVSSDLSNNAQNLNGVSDRAELQEFDRQAKMKGQDDGGWEKPEEQPATLRLASMDLPEWDSGSPLFLLCCTINLTGPSAVQTRMAEVPISGLACNDLPILSN